MQTSLDGSMLLLFLRLPSLYVVDDIMLFPLQAIECGVKAMVHGGWRRMRVMTSRVICLRYFEFAYSQQLR